MVCRCDSCQLDLILTKLTKQGKTLMALQEDLNSVTDQLGKAKGEILKQVADLEARIANLEGLVTENADAKVELDAAKEVLANLRSGAQALDDINPDATPEPQPEPTPEPAPTPEPQPAPEPAPENTP